MVFLVSSLCSLRYLSDCSFSSARLVRLSIFFAFSVEIDRTFLMSVLFSVQMFVREVMAFANWSNLLLIWSIWSSDDCLCLFESLFCGEGGECVRLRLDGALEEALGVIEGLELV